MKYIIDYRYKVINSLLVTTNWVLSSYDRGKSDEFSKSLESLSDQLPPLSELMSPPFNPIQITELEKLKQSVSSFLQLPDNFQEEGSLLKAQLKTFLNEIDPFSLSYEETIENRKGQILELIKDLQIYIEISILSLEGQATSLIDEKALIQDITSEIKNIENSDFETLELETLSDLIVASEEHLKNPNFENAREFLLQTLKVEKLFHKNFEETITPSEIICLLHETFTMVQEEVSDKEESYELFTQVMNNEAVQILLHELSNISFGEPVQDQMLINALLNYEAAIAEDGETEFSRYKAIDHYKIFGEELQKLYQFLENQ